MTLRGKTVEELREELTLINRTITALENLGRLRTETPSKAVSIDTRPSQGSRARKVVQTH
jgi:hypothetical protein